MKCCTGAKINLSLDVVGKKSDGYHLIETVIHPVSVCDCLRFSLCDRGVHISSDSDTLSCGNDNLAFKAADCFFTHTGITSGIEIFIEKSIPEGAGLGGGSSDAACVLSSLNNMFSGNLDCCELCRMGVSLGADVPFFLENVPVLATGMGDVLKPVDYLPECCILIFYPGFPIYTKDVYSVFGEYDIKSSDRPDTEGVICSLKNGNLDELAACAANVLEIAAFDLYPVLKHCKLKLLHMGAKVCLMSGSGSSVFALFDREIRHDDFLCLNELNGLEHGKTFIVKNY